MPFLPKNVHNHITAPTVRRLQGRPVAQGGGAPHPSLPPPISGLFWGLWPPSSPSSTLVPFQSPLESRPEGHSRPAAPQAPHRHSYRNTSTTVQQGSVGCFLVVLSFFPCNPHADVRATTTAAQVRLWVAPPCPKTPGLGALLPAASPWTARWGLGELCPTQCREGRQVGFSRQHLPEGRASQRRAPAVLCAKAGKLGLFWYRCRR